jgi:hypothetical protein
MILLQFPNTRIKEENVLATFLEQSIDSFVDFMHMLQSKHSYYHKQESHLFSYSETLLQHHIEGPNWIKD